MPTFGNPTLYSTETGWGANELYLGRYTLAEAGYLTKIVAGLLSLGASQPVRAVIYDINGNLVAQSDEVVVSATTPTWYQFTFPSVPLNAGDYWVGVYLPPTTGIHIALDMGVAGTGSFRICWGAGSAPPASLAGLETGTLTWEASIYAEYELTPPAPQWTLLITAGVGGTVNLSTVTGLPGTSTPTIIATPDATHTFSHWIYDGVSLDPAVYPSSVSNTINDTLTHTLEATFTLIVQYTLTVQSDPSGIEFTIT